VELLNGDGKYAVPGQGGLALLDIGCQVEFSPGYVTSAGNEWSPGLAFSLEAFENTRSGGASRLMLHALDGWKAGGEIAVVGDNRLLPGFYRQSRQ
jgi:hypothetical protein